MTLDQLIQNRRSIRKYKTGPVPQTLVDSILEAGRLAPSASNKQTWNFLIVRDKELRHQMVAACKNQEMVAQAPLTLVLWTHGDRMMSCGQSAMTVDCSIALSFMMLKATELGLGSCWLGAFDAEAVKKLLGLPQDAMIVAITPIGFPDEAPAPRPRKPMQEIAEYRG